MKRLLKFIVPFIASFSLVIACNNVDDDEPGIIQEIVEEIKTVCEAGTFSKDGKTNCKPVSAGTYSSTSGSSSCSPGPAACNTVDSTTGKCLTCADGYVLSNGKCIAE